MNLKQAYDILQISIDATEGEVKKAYRKQSLKHHPDKNNGSVESTEKFNDINNAFSFITNKNGEHTDGIGSGHGDMDDFINMLFKGVDMNNLYDMEGMEGRGGVGGMGGGANINGISFKMGGHGGHGGMPGGQPSMTNLPFGMKMFTKGAFNMQKPPPIMASIEITMDQAYEGVKFPLNVKRWNGRPGMNEETEVMYVDVPPGIDNNEMIVLTNMGHVCNETLKGDVKIFIKVVNDTEFKRDGLNIILQKTISLKDALCGFTFSVKHLSGKTYTLKNNRLVTPNMKTTIQKLGFNRDGSSGALILDFIIEFPEEITDDMKAKLQEIL